MNYDRIVCLSKPSNRCDFGQMYVMMKGAFSYMLLERDNRSMK